MLIYALMFCAMLPNHQQVCRVQSQFDQFQNRGACMALQRRMAAAGPYGSHHWYCVRRRVEAWEPA